MTYEIYGEIAQEEYFRTEADAALDEETERVADMNSLGESDGRRHKLPQHPEQFIYWQGYCDGLQQFWYKKLKLSMPDEI
ncbi:hypothetical protein C7H19_24160 [Aphanothece hegewaldii CCALA 016]|uniref:Uncharacterized protein n=1 Tax=Aphanothece hegewaldii CCALA 016 TaxID=2107694 RepID=A0A2T1LR42_9CHRO|nr:hypothetical protein [Aphanothece hegewaldii]PSF30024.1 hypothetical protein C7H19_24160 [Aphanothece hegewaldii CCALA 016]